MLDFFCRYSIIRLLFSRRSCFSGCLLLIDKYWSESDANTL